MSSSFRHIDAARFMGSWPVLQDSSTILPRTLNTSARILGVVRETSSGYDVDGRSFYVVVDSDPAFSVTFSSLIALTLDDVITQINADSQANISADIAFRDNGFLLLKSPTSGTGSYLRVYTDPASTPTDVFEKLGLFSETESWGGDIASATHSDPDRQVAMPGQMSVMEGEPLTARVFNRALMQLSLQNDMVYNLTHRRRLAKATKEEIASYSSSSPEGYQFSGGTMVYVGPDTTPSVGQLAKYFQIIDSDGKEFTKEEITQLADYPGNLQCVEVAEIVTGTGATGVVYECRAISSVAIFSASDPEDNYYVTVDTGVAGLAGVPLKIIRYVSSTEIVFAAINPLTGADLTSSVLANVGTDGTYVSDIVKQSVELVPCQVEAVYDTAGGSRVEGVNTARISSIVPTRVELGNRIVFVGENLTTAGVAVGDELIWSGHTPTTGVQDNNGTYRISAVIDKETVEVVAGDWHPAVLTGDLTTAGTVTIRVDGLYVEDPFLKFVESPSGAIPEVGDALTIQYYGMRTLKEAWDEDDTLISGDLERQHESSDIIEKAILNILGPSTNSIEDYVRQQASNNLEALDYRVDREHYRLGKHRSINADTLFVYQNPTVNEYLDQRGPTNWGAELATFWHLGDIGTGEAVASIVTKSTDVDPGGGTDYVGGFKVFIEGASSDMNLWGYASDLTVESNTDTNSRAAVGYKSNVNFSDGNIDTVAHFYGGIATWTGTNSLTNEYGLYLPSMIRGDTQVGLQLDSMSGAATEAYAVRAGSISAPAAYGISLVDVTGTTTLARGFSASNITGETEGTAFRAGDVVSNTTTASLLRGVSVTGNTAYGITLSNISADAGSAIGVNIADISSTSAGAYGMYANNLTAGGSAIGARFGAMEGTGGGAYGIWADTITGGPFARGMRTLGISGEAAAGLLFNGAITATVGDSAGMQVAGAIGGVTSSYLLKSGAITCSAGDAGALLTGAISSTTGSAYGLATGAITGVTAYGAISGDVSATNEAAGIYLGAVDSSAGLSTGFRTGAISGDTGARGLYATSLALNPGGAGDAILIQSGTVAGDNAYGLYCGGLTANAASPNIAALGYVASVAGAECYGLYTGAMTSSDGLACVVWADAVQADNNARGVRIVSLTADTGIAAGGWIGNITGTAGGALGWYLEDVIGSGGIGRGFRVGAVTGTNASSFAGGGIITATTGAAVGTWFTDAINGVSDAAVVLANNVTASAGNGYGFTAGNIGGTTTAYGLNLGAVTASAGPAYGVNTGNIQGTTLAYGVNVGTVNATSGSSTAYGMWLGAVSGATAYGLEIDSVTGSGGTGYSYGIVVGTVSDADARGIDVTSVLATGQAFGVRAGNVTGDRAYGFFTNFVTGGTAGAYGVFSSNVSATGSNAYGAYVATVSSTTADAYGLYITAVTAASGTPWAIYTQSSAGDLRFGSDIYTSGNLLPETWTQDIGSSSIPFSHGFFYDNVLIGDALTLPSNHVPLRVWKTYSTGTEKVYGITANLTSTQEDTTIDIQAGRFAAISQTTTEIQTSCTGLYAVSNASSSGTGGTVGLYGLWAATAINTGAATVTNVATIYAQRGNRSAAPQYDVGVLVERHYSGTVASASIHTEGGAVLISGTGTAGSLGVSPSLNLLSSTYIDNATQYAISLMGTTGDPATVGFVHTGINAALDGGVIKFGYFDGTKTFKIQSESRNLALSSDLVIFDRESVAPVTAFYNARVEVNRSNARCFDINCDIDSTSFFDPTTTVNVTLTGVPSGGPINGLVASRIFIDSASTSDGKYAGTDGMRGQYIRVEVPGDSSSVVAYGSVAVVGKSYAETIVGSSVGYRSYLNLSGNQASANGTAKGFEALITSTSKYAERYGFYVAAQNVPASAYGTVSAGFAIQSMSTIVNDSSTYGVNCGQITTGSSGTSIDGSYTYGFYCAGITNYMTIGSNDSNYIYGVYIGNMAMSGAVPDVGAGEGQAFPTIFYGGGISGNGVFAKGLHIENISGYNEATGIKVNDIDGEGITVSATTGGISIGSVSGPLSVTAAYTWGLDIDGVTSAGTVRGISVKDITSTGDEVRGIHVGTVGTGTDSHNNYGIYVGPVQSGGSNTAFGVYIDTPTSAGTRWSLYAKGYCYLGDSGQNVYSPAIQNTNLGILGSPVQIFANQLGYGSSLREHKTNIEDLGSVPWLHSLRPVRFEYKAGLGVQHYGLIAEEVEEVAPELATYRYSEKEVPEDYSPKEGEVVSEKSGKKVCFVKEELISVSYELLIPVLLNEVQKLDKKVAELEARLN